MLFLSLLCFFLCLCFCVFMCVFCDVCLCVCVCVCFCPCVCVCMCAAPLPSLHCPRGPHPRGLALCPGVPTLGHFIFQNMPPSYFWSFGHGDPIPRVQFIFSGWGAFLPFRPRGAHPRGLDFSFLEGVMQPPSFWPIGSWGPYLPGPACSILEGCT